MCQNHKYRNEILNHRFGKLIAIEYAGQSKNQKRSLWKCKCDCGGEKVVRSDCLRQGGVTSCGCKKKLAIGNKNKFWKGHEEIGLAYFNRIKAEAKDRSLEFTVTIEQIWDLFIKQNRKCALSGIDLRFKTKAKDFDQSASLDRIDSSKGYIEGNVQWVDKRINLMKWDFPQEEFIELCNKISCHYHKTNESDCQSEENGGIPL